MLLGKLLDKNLNATRVSVSGMTDAAALDVEELPRSVFAGRRAMLAKCGM